MREFREEVQPRLTQERLAARADLSKQYLADVEAGRRNPTWLVLERIRRALGLTWQALAARLDDAERAGDS